MTTNPAWPLVAAKAGASPWPQVAGVAAYHRLFLSSSTYLHNAQIVLLLFLSHLFPTHLYTVVAPTTGRLLNALCLLTQCGVTLSSASDPQINWYWLEADDHELSEYLSHLSSSSTICDGIMAQEPVFLPCLSKWYSIMWVFTDL